MRSNLVLFVLPLLGACASGTIQGQIGFVELTGTSIELDDPADEVEDEGGASMPTVGAAVQLDGVERGSVRAGLEWGGTISWENDRGAVSVGNGTIVVVSENDYLLADLFAGLYADLALGTGWRLYAGAGPLMQYGSIDLEYVDEASNEIDVGGDGFGLGAYARCGLERRVGSSMIGFGIRWSESSIDPGSGIGDLELEGVQFLVTATQRL